MSENNILFRMFAAVNDNTNSFDAGDSFCTVISSIECNGSENNLFGEEM